MTITWKLGGRVLSDNDHYVLKIGGEEVKVPLMFKIGTKNGKDMYGYLDYDKFDFSHTLIYYILKKCFYGVSLVGGEGQGVVKTDRGVYKIKLLSLGDFRIAADTTWEDAGKNKLILFDKVYNHKEQEALYDSKKSKTSTASYEKQEDEAKNDGGAKAVPSSISAEGFIRYAQTYDSELLRLVLEDQELYQQMFEQDGPTNLVLRSLLTMFLPNGKGGRHIKAIQQEGITDNKWEHFFKLALKKAPPSSLESIRPGSMFELLELIVRIDYKPARLLLNENAEWREGFGQLLLQWNENPLRLFSSYFEINEEAKAGDDDTRQAIDAELFKTLVDLKPGWLLDIDDAKGSYFKQLAIYLQTHRDQTLHSVFTSNLPLLQTRLQRDTEIEALTLHFLTQEPFDLKHCDYLGLKKGFSSLTKPFQPKTNQLIVSRIKVARSLEEKLYILEFFSPCLRPHGKNAILQHLLEPSTINACDQAVIKLFDEISSEFELFAASSNQYLDNDGNNWLVYNQFLNHPKSEQFQHAPKLLEKLMTLEGGNINHCNQEKLWSLFEKAQGGVFIENFNRYLNRGGNDWRVYNKFLEEFKGELSPYTPRLFLRLIALGEEELLMKFTSTGVDLTQALEELKSGKLTLPALEGKASSAKLESLARMLKIRHPLTTAEILVLLYKSDKEIVDFCLSEGNEDLKVAILGVYKDILPWPTKIMQDSFLRALGILPILAPKHILQLTKTTTGRQVIDFCKEHDAYPVFEILKAYAHRFHDVKLSPDEIIMFALNKETASLLACAQIKEVGYQDLFKILQRFENHADLACNLFTNGPTLSTQDLDELIRNYPWARQFAGSLKMHQTSHPDVKVNFRVTNGALTFDTDSNSQGSSIFNSNIASKLIRGVNGVSTAFDFGTESIKFAEEPSLVRALGVTANLLLLICVIRPGSAIAHTRFYIQILAKAPMDIQEHGMLDAIINLVSNLGTTYLGTLESLSLPPYPKTLYGIGASAIGGCYRSAMRFFDTIAPYFTHKNNDSEQCEILLALEFGYTAGASRAVIDNLPALRAMGYNTVLLDESYEIGFMLKDERLDSKNNLLTTYENAKITYENDTDLIDQYAALIEAVQVGIDLLSTNLTIYRLDVPNAQLIYYGVKKILASISTQAEKICSKGYKKQILIIKNNNRKQLLELLRGNFKVTPFAVWDRKGACNRSFKKYPFFELASEAIEIDNSHRCQIRESNASLPVLKKLGMENVLILDSYKNPQLNITEAVLEHLDYKDKAKLWTLAQSGNAKAQYYLATILLQEGKREEATKWAGEAANKGFKEGLEIFVRILEEDGKAEYAQRIKHMKGLIHAIQLLEAGGNKTEAKRIAQETADWQSTPGLSVLKRILEEEGDMDGVKNILYVLQTHASMLANDTDGAKKAALKAAKAGSMYGQVVLGALFDDNGELKEAAYWYKEAMNQGSSAAKVSLKDITRKMANKVIESYEAGNIAEAEILAQEAAKYGSYGEAVLAIINGNNQTLEEIYRNNQDEEVKRYISRAVDTILKDKQAKHDLALSEMHFYTAEEARKKAETLFRENAEQGFVPSQVELAILLIASNRRTEAKKWAVKAAKKGSLLGKDIAALFKDGDTGKEDLYERAKAQGSEELNNKLKPLHDKAHLIQLSEDIEAEYRMFDGNSLNQWLIAQTEELKKGASQEEIALINMVVKQQLGAYYPDQVDVAGQNAGSETDEAS